MPSEGLVIWRGPYVAQLAIPGRCGQIEGIPGRAYEFPLATCALLLAQGTDWEAGNEETQRYVRPSPTFQGEPAYLGEDKTVGGPGGSPLSPSVVRSSATGGPKSAAQMPVRALEEYSSEPLVSNSTNCTAAINAALKDISALDVPIQLLGKRYLTEGRHLLPSYINIRGTGCYIDLAVGSMFELEGSVGDVNVLQSESWGTEATVDSTLTLQDFGISGNMFNQSGLGVTAMPQAYLTATLASAATEATVNSTENFAESGLLWIGAWLFKYTSTTATTFKGLTPVGSHSGILALGAWVTPHNSQGHSLALQARLCRLQNISIHESAASNLMIQGVPAAPAYENYVDGLKTGLSNRFAVELGEQAHDNNFSLAVLGPFNGMGCLLIRGFNLAMTSPHFIGNISPADATVVVAAGSPVRMTAPDFDSNSWQAIRLDTAVRGGVGAILDPNFTDICNTTHPNYCGAPSSCFMTTRRGGNESSFRGRFTGVVGESENYKYAVRNGARALTVGIQNLKEISEGSGLLQLDTVADFIDAPAATQTVSCSGNTLSYAGKRKSVSQVSGAVAAGATHFALFNETIPASAAFAAGGGWLLVGGGHGAAPVQLIKYTAYSGKEFTGIPASGEGSIGTIIPAETAVSQCFLTGVTGGTSTSIAANTVATQAAAKMWNGAFFDLAATGVDGPPLSLESADHYNTRRGTSRSTTKGAYYQGVLELPAKATSLSIEHKLFTTPTILNAAPQGELAAGVRYWVTATATEVTVHTSGETVGAIKFTVTAEIPPES